MKRMYKHMNLFYVLSLTLIVALLVFLTHQNIIFIRTLLDGSYMFSAHFTEFRLTVLIVSLCAAGALLMWLGLDVIARLAYNIKSSEQEKN